MCRFSYYIVRPKTHHQNNPTWKRKKAEKEKKPVETSKPAQSNCTEQLSNIHRRIAFHGVKTGTRSRNTFSYRFGHLWHSLNLSMKKLGGSSMEYSKTMKEGKHRYATEKAV